MKKVKLKPVLKPLVLTLQVKNHMKGYFIISFLYPNEKLGEKDYNETWFSENEWVAMRKYFRNHPGHHEGGWQDCWERKKRDSK